MAQNETPDFQQEEQNSTAVRKAAVLDVQKSDWYIQNNR